ncbi:MAG: sugar transferase [Proteobacteria bacterium]|nr:sugar transferase [Pseudomonadota bacterium]
MKDFVRDEDIALALPVGPGAPAALPEWRPATRDVAPHRTYRDHGKRILDIGLVVLGLPLVLPLTGLLALALWLEGGQPFYRQERIGRGGRRFSIVKLRTMVRDADQMLHGLLEADPALRREWMETQKLKKDPRITRIGALLRKTSLDEMPQLWNVLKGEMSLVSPRPMLPEQMPLYGDPDPYLALRPGITGVWQVSARNEKSFAYRNEMDSVYNAGLRLGLDVVILWKTFGVVLRRTGY